MSIELLPPDDKYPNEYHVRVNKCRCHPETCCCDDWAIYSPLGEKFSTHFNKSDADLFAELLNKDMCHEYTN